MERGRQQILSNTCCRSACCLCSRWSTWGTLVKRHIRLKLTQHIPQGTEEKKSRKLLFAMLLIIKKQIQKRMLQFPRACTTLLRHFKLPSQHLEYVAAKLCLRLDQPSLVNNWFCKSLTREVRIFLSKIFCDCANAMHDIMLWSQCVPSIFQKYDKIEQRLCLSLSQLYINYGTCNWLYGSQETECSEEENKFCPIPPIAALVGCVVDGSVVVPW